MAEEVILKVGVEGTGEGETKIKSLKAQLREMKNELLGLDEGSDRFKQLSKEAGELTDKIGDVSDKVKALSSDTKKLDALVGVGSAIAGGFQAAQGAMALFGSDSKQVEKAIQNIIAVQGILNGVQQVGQFLTAKGIVQDQIANAGLLIKSGAIATVTAAQWLWNAAMTANPIGLIIVAIGALTAGVIWLTKNLEKAAQFFFSLFGYSTQLESEELKMAQRREQRSKAAAAEHQQRLKEIDEQKKARIDAADKQIAALELEKDTLEANGKSSEAVTVKILEAELEKTKAVLEANRQKIQSWVDYYTNLSIISGQSEEEFKAQMKTRGIDLDLLQEKATTLIANNEANVQRSENAITKFKREANEARVTDAELTAEELAEIERLRLEAIVQQDIEDAQAYQDFLQRNLDADKAFNEEQLRLEQEQSDAEFAILEARIDQENLLKEQQAQADKERQERNLQTATNFTNAARELTTSLFTLSNNLGKQDEASQLARAKRQFQIKKALDMAEAAIDGTKAVLSTFANTPGGLVIKSIAASAAGVIAGLKIAAIGSAKFEGATADTSISSPNIGGATESVGNTTPQVSPINAGSTFLNSEPGQVYVLEKDITKTQNKVGAIVAEATF